MNFSFKPFRNYTSFPWLTNGIHKLKSSLLQMKNILNTPTKMEGKAFYIEYFIYFSKTGSRPHLKNIF